MKTNTIIATLGLAAALCWSGCVREPVSCFNQSESVAEPGDAISFTNCSWLGSSYRWDFGDGSFSDQKEPTHTYVAPGFYTITLEVSNKSGSKTGTSANVITIGNRLISSLQVNSIPATDSTGAPWDAADDPDLVLYLWEGGAPAGTPAIITTENTDLADAIPASWDVSADGVNFSDTNWYYELRDNDGSSYQIMGSGTFQPYTDAVDKAITIQDGDLWLVFTYEIDY